MIRLKKNLSKKNDLGARFCIQMEVLFEVAVGIAPTHRGFADPCLTAWLRDRLEVIKQYHFLLLFSSLSPDRQACLPFSYNQRSPCLFYKLERIGTNTINPNFKM
jgi:hypothetical protein